MGDASRFIDASESRTITAKEAAVLLCVSQSTIYRLFNSGELASCKAYLHGGMRGLHSQAAGA